MPDGELYSEDARDTRCGWVDCPNARLARVYTIPCERTDRAAEALASALTARRFPQPTRLTGEYIAGQAWDVSFVPAEVTTHKVWARFDIVGAGDRYDSRPPGCSISYVLSVARAG